MHASSGASRLFWFPFGLGPDNVVLDTVADEEICDSPARPGETARATIVNPAPMNDMV